MTYDELNQPESNSEFREIKVAVNEAMFFLLITDLFRKIRLR